MANKGMYLTASSPPPHTLRVARGSASTMAFSISPRLRRQLSASGFWRQRLKKLSVVVLALLLTACAATIPIAPQTVDEAAKTSPYRQTSL
jgi:peptidoglycan/LPS O-acetylase OafA/YrhL